MKLSGASVTIFFLGVVTVAVGVVAPVATAEMPAWSKPHLWIAWPILGVLAVAFGVLTVIQAGKKDSERRGEREPLTAGRHQEEKPPPLMTKPPEPYFAHPYPLQEHFTGRVGERQMLTDWLTDNNHAVLGLIAIGGMGKSSVAWVWLHRDVLDLPVPGLSQDAPEGADACRLPDDARPEGAMWWSFYEGGGTFAGFLEAAIAYCSGGKKSSTDYLTEPGPTGPSMDYWAMQADVLQLAQQRRFVFVWDGAERLLREYGGLDASMREERDREEMEPDARDALEMAVERFLHDMAGQSSSRLLVVSRLYPRVLDKLAGSRCQELTGLAQDDAVAYLRARGINGNRAELATAAAQYEFHPLSLSNLAADLLEDFHEQGDISAAPRHDETESLKARLHHILERAYDRRAPQRRELLSRLSAMRGTIPKEVVELLARDIRSIDAKNLGREVAELIRHGLLRPSRDGYDFHPVVRRYCYERLKGKQKVHLRLRDYFAAVPAPREEEVQSLEDLAPVVELYHHTVRAGRHDEARELYRDRVMEPLYFRFGAYHMCIELIRVLFPDGEEELPRLRGETAQAWTLNELATYYDLSGQPRSAVGAFEKALKLAEKVGDRGNAAVVLVNLANERLELGELAAAEGNVRRSIDLLHDIGDEAREAVGHKDLGRLLAYRGIFAESEHHLQTAQEVFDALGAQRTSFVSVVRAYGALRALLTGDARAALEAARRARELADQVAKARFPVERDSIRAEWLLGAALVALASVEKGRQDQHLKKAQQHLTEALTRCRRINLVQNEPDMLLAWARWHRAKGNGPQAQEHAEEALAIADRCEYRLVQADAHNLLAQLALGAGDKKAARRHAETARERAWCDGPPHCYKPALEEAERLLKESGG